MPLIEITSLGTPLHQPEEDQQILPSVLQQQQTQQIPPPLAPMGGLTPTLGLGMGMSLSQSPTKYVTGFTTPQSLMQPQTPVKNTILTLMSYVLIVF